MLNISKSVLMKKNSFTSWMARGWYRTLGPVCAHRGWFYWCRYHGRFYSSWHDVISSHRQWWQCGCRKFGRYPPVCRCCWFVCNSNSWGGICGWCYRSSSRWSC